MKKLLLIILAVLLLLTGCGPHADTTNTHSGDATQPTQGQVGYPTELEADFVVLSELMDGNAFLPTPSVSSLFHLVSKKPLTQEDVTVTGGDLLWDVQLSEVKRYEGNSITNDSHLYAAFLAYKDMDWAQVYSTMLQSQAEGSKLYNQHLAEYKQKYDQWYPEFYCYLVFIHGRNYTGPAVDGTRTITDLSVTVNGSTQELNGVCNFVIYDYNYSAIPDEAPLAIATMTVSPVHTYPTREGYFYSCDHNKFKAKKDLTITGARFLNCDTASFVKMELVIGDVRMEWDGKTAIDVAAGETVMLRYIAQDPTVGNILNGCFERNAVLEYTHEGASYDCFSWTTYLINPDAYECYAIANGRRDALFSYYADNQNYASGWYPGYVRYGYVSGDTGNPFLDY